MPPTTPSAPAVRSRRAITEQPDTAMGALGDGLLPTTLLYDGPWSRVYRAQAAGSAATEPGQYAVKIVSPATSDSLLAENMLRREAGVLQSVRQSNLVALLGCQLNAPTYYLLTPFLEGATLADVLAENLPVPLRHALWVTRQIARALEALHTAGWMHADIKPENIHIAPSGHATLLDLGLARRMEGRASTTSQTAIRGTLNYTAPEWFCDGAPVDGRSDLYSLGAVLYQLLAGRPPFAAPNAASLVEAHLHAAPGKLHLPKSAVAADVHELVARMLAKDPLRRPQTSGDLAQRLMCLEIATMADSLSLCEP